MKVLITGSCGLLGMKLEELFKKNDYTVYGIDILDQIEKNNCYSLDITQKDDVEALFKKVNPDVVLHTAAYTDVDGCEKDRDTAFSVNVQGTRNVAESAEEIGAKLVYVSTDYVFNGDKGLYVEDDVTDPIDYYGVTKLEGEKVVEKVCSDYVIARTSVIFGSNKMNFALWVVDMLKKGRSIDIVIDQFVSPTLNVDLSEQLLALIEKNAKGVFHTCGGERVSRFGFVNIIAEVFDLDKNLVSPVKMEDMNWVAKRPMDSSLNTSKVSAFKKPYKLRDAVRLLQKDMGDIIV